MTHIYNRLLSATEQTKSPSDIMVRYHISLANEAVTRSTAEAYHQHKAQLHNWSVTLNAVPMHVKPLF